MSTFNPRRAFRSDRLRDLYLTATREGWSHKYDGAGHLHMWSPDGKAHMSLSMTSNAARSALNSEAVFKRWLRFHDAITVVSGIPFIEPTPTPPEEPPVTYDADHIANQHDDEDAAAAGPITSIASEANPPIRYLCADGCGQVVTKAGGYAKGHHPASQANAAKARAAKRTVRTNPEPRGDGERLIRDDRFTIGDVIDIANFAGDGGIVEVEKLRLGLNLMLKMRANR